MSWNVLPGTEKNWINFRYATQHRWISGRVKTVHRRLVDVLNSEGTDIMAVEQVEVRDRRDGATCLTQADVAEISIGKALIAVPAEDEAKPAARPDPMVWVKKKPEWVRVGIGPYELVGQVHLAELGQVIGFFSVVRDKFIPMTQVTVRNLNDPTFVERFEVLLVNRIYVDYAMAATPPQDGAI